MKLGFITSILDGWTYEQMMDLLQSRDLNVWKWHGWARRKSRKKICGCKPL